MLWISLGEMGLAPPTFGGMTDNAWAYFIRLMLAEPKFEFLLLCDDIQWKLRKWCIHSYSSWYTKWQDRKLKLQVAKAKAAVELDAKGVLEDPNLIQFGTNSDSHSIDENCDDEDGNKEDITASSSPPAAAA